MKRELGVARCGLACCLCTENSHCSGCNTGECPDKGWCENRRCSLEKGIAGCFACTQDCRKGLLGKVKPYAFTRFARAYGMEKLLDCLERNEQLGVVYHREGINGDYDRFLDADALERFLLTGHTPQCECAAFARTTDFPRGTLLRLLQSAYAFDERYEQHELAKWKEFDNFFYDNPTIADKYGFITIIDGQAAGFVSWDPRKLPDVAEIGHNGVSAAFKSRGVGRAQMREAVRRALSQGASRLIVTTDQLLGAAQRTYESAGFRVVARRPNPDETSFVKELVDYELLP